MKTIDNFPLVSVIIPVYNAQEFIVQTLNSVLNQTYKNWEAIIVDDQSTDNTLGICKNFAEKDSRFTVYEISHSGMPSKPRNYGANLAKGKLLAFLDSDDIWTKNKLEVQVKSFYSKDEFVLSYCCSVTFGKVNFFSPYFEVLPLIFKACKSKIDLIKKGNAITTSSVLVRKEAFIKCGGFDENPKLKAVEDYDLWIRLGDLGNYQFIPKLLVYYRIHNSNPLSGNWKVKAERLDTLRKLRSLDIPDYNFYRNKNLLLRFVRNLIHLINFVLLKIISFKFTNK